MRQLIYMSIVLPLLGLLSRENPHLRNPTIRYYIGSSLGAFTKKNYVLYPLLWLLSGVMTHLQLLALVIPYSGNTKVRCDTGSSLDTFNINKCNFLLPLFTPFGSTVRGKGNPKIAYICHSVLGNPTVRYDTGFSIAFLHKYM